MRSRTIGEVEDHRLDVAELLMPRFGQLQQVGRHILAAREDNALANLAAAMTQCSPRLSGLRRQSGMSLLFVLPPLTFSSRASSEGHGPSKPIVALLVCLGHSD